MPGDGGGLPHLVGTNLDVTNANIANLNVDPNGVGNVVTTNGAQTITGVKKLTGGAVADHLTVTGSPWNDTLADGVTPTPSGIATGPIWDYGGQAFNVMAAGAVGNNATEDSGAFQRVLDKIAAAGSTGGGRMVIPRPTVGYKISTTLNIVPSAGQAFIDIEADLTTSTAINWAGANSSAIFSALGWKSSSVRGVKLNIPATSTGVVGWDLDTSASIQSLSDISFYDCVVGMAPGAASCVGWRMGQVGGGAGDISFLNWFGCDVSGGSNANSNVGWLNQTQNCLQWNWYGGKGINLDTMFSNDTNKFAVRQGGNSMYFHGLSGQINLNDFVIQNGGTVAIFGGDFEGGAKFLATHSQTAANEITVSGVRLVGYAPGDNIVFNILSPCNLTINGMGATGSDYTAAFITAPNTQPGRLVLDGCAIRTTADPPFTLNAFWTADVRASSRLNSSGVVTAFLTPRAGALTGTFAPTYSASMTGDLTKGKKQRIAVTNGTAFTLTAPAGFEGQELIWEIVNTSGVGCGVITMDASQHLAGGVAFVGPGTGKYRVIALTWDQTFTEWVELYRSTADI
jgi:hypothetical protein